MSGKPNVWFCGDPHGVIEHVVRAIERHGAPDAVVLLGDLEPPCDLAEWLAPVAARTCVRLIHGNHDTDRQETWDRIRNSRAWASNLDGRVEMIAGLRIAGLGGIFRARAWYPPAEPTWYSLQAWESSLPPGRPGHFASQRLIQASTIFPQTIEVLAAQQADILVTHEAPGAHRHGFRVIDELAAAMGVQRLFHGHHHERHVYEPEGERRMFGAGLREIVGLDGEVIIATQQPASHQEYSR